ncbi:DUF4097 family beta strand repeat-containing protein [Streptococcus suis]|uniref:DUF4097 domain-containing protein n=2 Tax=Streptococcus suis TaxID=1307 RepID=A0AA87F9C4_STRSU|nr:DUF4097 family beta strand repeat-containing protein [Streptococcus suis]ATZ02749.1 hypothetical protein CVO91_01600 [Streptococcus suis]EHC03114.1 hypothetical protein SSUR61_0846 [Streptococcus suis R61]MBY5001497.1 DUF4097 domain-containing protein [Streptococcus suis]MBY5012598.1 DUF4097 domain-containing protein [Streptococcus suis]MBY5019371.1 DUF4097 domain-containing protein [Streptococcus suis]
MKKKLTIAIIIGFVSLIAGLILAGIGFFTGGITRLEEVAAPTEVHKTFTDLNTIKIDFIPHSVYIKESSDNNYHVTYANSDNNIQNPLNLSEKDGVLTLSAQELEFAIEGIMQYLGESLAQRRINVFSVTIEVPKGKTLNKLERDHFYKSASFVIENVHIKEANLSGGVDLNKVTIDSGQIETGYFQATQSTLKDMHINLHESSVRLSETSLENVTIEGYSQLDSRQLTLLGDNRFTPSDSYSSTTFLDLTDKSLADSNLLITNQIDKKKLVEAQGYYYEDGNDLGEMVNQDPYLQERLGEIGIFTSDKYTKYPVKTENDLQTLTLENKGSKNKLTIEATNATINLGTPK